MVQFDYLVFIGRFQLFHHGHEFVVREALSRAKTVIMLIGSANSPRTIKNPFSFDERESMILKAFENDTADSERIICMPIDDTLYNDHKWLQNVQQAVSFITQNEPANIGIIGHTKDDSSYYLSLFPDWGFVELPSFENLSATPLRRAYFLDERLKNGDDWQDKMPAPSVAFLQKFAQTDDFTHLQREYRHVLDYQKAWQSAPYPPVFVTADALVVQAGHVLLIERGGEYGRGLYALAGGFLDKDESLLDCALRELQEETGLIISPSTLKASHTFDAPDRSARGRTVTTVFYFELTGDKLPDVAGGDDASLAFWLPLGELDGRMMFEDHYSVITKVLGL
ncbi:bifunctional nicotinamide-nucleotide adenylyltransferase/Nudix hydroxylase [Moraxella bovis]|uniref:bifunctional nicotinamide-nucleotide adenylyltransferase/Nudix hydroxylase n=1 Tax=Moraxella bovis TaxID=476 RepID=UPI00227C6C4B|nr:bifunctional nicotinamide-nucleotide adenylyltransferase/Nudix hydroxylase [Moraxella bovis]WAJ74123.1 bifunctional nicotinamide-nucleotide adenylyltransferase/Nudix hydroxylase [Moraxella bovis]